MNQTADQVEADAARVRRQLVTIGTDIRHQADPSVIIDTAKTSFKRRTEGVPTFLKENATPIGMVMLGGAMGAVLTGLFTRPSKGAVAAPRPLTNGSYSRAPSQQPTTQVKAKAALLSTLGLGLGYVAGMFVPKTPTEERVFAEPKAVLGEKLDDFLKANTRGMKMAAVNAFGASRISATALIGLAVVAELLGPTPSRPKANRL